MNSEEKIKTLLGRPSDRLVREVSASREAAEPKPAPQTRVDVQESKTCSLYVMTKERWQTLRAAAAIQREEAKQARESMSSEGSSDGVSPREAAERAVADARKTVEEDTASLVAASMFLEQCERELDALFDTGDLRPYLVFGHTCEGDVILKELRASSLDEAISLVRNNEMSWRTSPAGCPVESSIETWELARSPDGITSLLGIYRPKSKDLIEPDDSGCERKGQ